jgi:beta-galactosidase
MPADVQQQIDAGTTLTKPTLWSPEHPNMYSMVTQIKEGGHVIDEYRTPFGIRTFVFDLPRDFRSTLKA